MKSLESSNPEIWNFLNNGSFSLQKLLLLIVKTQTPFETKIYSLKSGAVVYCAITADYNFIFFVDR